MGLFDGLDVASAADNPFEVEPGTYDAVVTGVETKPTKDESKIGLNIEFTIEQPGGPMDGRKVMEWKQIPSDVTTAEGARAASFLKQRLANLGVPESRMNDVDSDDLIGTECVVSVKKNGEYTNVTKVALRQEQAAGGLFS